MARITESLNGGMVTSQDPSTLQPGELQGAYNCMYYQDNEHLSRIPGVSLLASAQYKPAGLAACRFTNGRHDLISQQVYASGGTNYSMYAVSSAESATGMPYASASALASGDYLVSVMADDRHYLFNGNNENLVYLRDGTFRPHGLKPAVDGGFSFYRLMNDLDGEYASAAAGVDATGYYEYWYTESLTFSDGQILESTFEKAPLTYEIKDLAAAPVFNLPTTPANKDYALKYNAKLHYNVYRSEKKLQINDRQYPVGRKIGETQQIDTSGGNILRPVFKDTASVANTGPKAATILCGILESQFGGIVNDAFGTHDYSTLFTAVASGGAATLTEAVSASGGGYIRIKAVKGANGWVDGTNGSWISGGAGYGNVQVGLGFRGFDFGTFSGTISGIDVVVKARTNSSNNVQIKAMPVVYDAVDGPETVAGKSFKPHPAEGGSPKTFGGAWYTPGSNAVHQSDWDPFGRMLSGDRGLYIPPLFSGNPGTQVKPCESGDFTNIGFGKSNSSTVKPNFIVSPYTWKTSDVGPYFGVSLLIEFLNTSSEIWLDIDSVSMNIYYNSAGEIDPTQINKRGQFYDAVTIEQNGVQVAFGSRNKGPIASCGAMFQGALVTDSKDTPNRLYYSLPGFPDAFPKDVYWLELPGVNNDKITSINVVNDRLVVGTRGNLWRINYLPNQDDAGFSRGEAVSLVSGSIGIVNPAAACVFTNQSGQQELAFVDANGIFSTDGYAIRKLSQDLLWVGPSIKAVMSPTNATSVYSIIKGLINDPRTQTLRLLTAAVGWAGSYAAIHAKQGGGLKWTKYSTIDSFGSVSCGTVLKRNTGSWVPIYGMSGTLLVDGQFAGKLYREDSSDSTTYNDPIGGLPADILTREIGFGNLGQEAAIDSIGIHGTIKPTPTSATFTNIGGSVAVTQHYTNRTSDAQSMTTIPGGISNSRNSQAGIDGVNCEELAIRLQLDDTSMFEIHAIHMDGSDFGEVDTSA